MIRPILAAAIAFFFGARIAVAQDATYFTFVSAETVSAGAASVAFSCNANGTHFRILCAQDFRMAWDSAAPVANANSTLIKANTAFWARCASGNKYATIQDTVAGNCSATYFKANATSQKQQYSPGLNP